jgi:nucleoside-diphosphate-sugar epimerase
MRVFLTGATGFVGSAIVPELIDAGHQVLGLARSDSGADSLIRAGVQVHRGDIEDLDSLRAGAAQSDAVIHTAFNHDFSKFAANCEADRHVIEALGSVLVGSDRPFIITSATGLANPASGQLATEQHSPASSTVMPRAATEEAAASVGSRGVKVIIVRLPQVHDTVKQGLVTYAIDLARQKGISAYIDNGLNRWPAAPRSDTAHLYRLALDNGKAGATYHAVAEEGVPLRQIAEVVGHGLNVPVVSLTPEEAASHFGWLSHFVGFDLPASSAMTREQLGWNPTGSGLISDLQNMRYITE